VVVHQASKIQMTMTNPKSDAEKKLAEIIQQMQDELEKENKSSTDIETLRIQLTAAIEAAEAEREIKPQEQDEFTKAFENVVKTNNDEKEAQKVFIEAQTALATAQEQNTSEDINSLVIQYSEAFDAAQKAAENNYNANKELNNLIKTKIETTAKDPTEEPTEESDEESTEILKQKHDKAVEITNKLNDLNEKSKALSNELKKYNDILKHNLDYTKPKQLENFNEALSKIKGLNDIMSKTHQEINSLDTELSQLFPSEKDVHSE
jgi:hypothetical protein